MRGAFAVLLLLLSAAAHAHGELREVRAGEAVVLRPDRAYFLFRTMRPPSVIPESPVFLRIPTNEELQAYGEARRRAYAAAEPNLLRRYEAELQRQPAAARPPVRPGLGTFNFVYSEMQNVDYVDIGRPFVGGRPESLYLVEALPGDYVLYGLRYGGNALAVCMCLGTVGFSAQAGIITDLGYILSDRVHEVSALPELRAESGFGPSSYGMLILWGATVRAARADSTIPDAIRSLPIHPVAYRAVGRFVEPRAMAINRLAPAPGILDYNGGRVVDAATGREVPDVN